MVWPGRALLARRCRLRDSSLLWGDQEGPSRRMPVEQEFGATEFRVVGRRRETFTENACRTGIRGNRILDGIGEKPTSC